MDSPILTGFERGLERGTAHVYLYCGLSHSHWLGVRPRAGGRPCLSIFCGLSHSHGLGARLRAGGRPCLSILWTLPYSPAFSAALSGGPPAAMKVCAESGCGSWFTSSSDFCSLMRASSSASHSPETQYSSETRQTVLPHMYLQQRVHQSSNTYS